MSDIKAAVAALGPGTLQEEALRRHIDPLFSRVLQEAGGRIYLANHSLGRPLDRMAEDVQEGLAFWYAEIDRAWTEWLTEMAMFRSRVATLIHAQGPHCIVPKASAGQGLRAVLNCHDEQLRVIATRNEFSSIDLILKAYAARGRIRIDWVKPHADRRYQSGIGRPLSRRRRPAGRCPEHEHRFCDRGRLQVRARWPRGSLALRSPPASRRASEDSRYRMVCRIRAIRLRATGAP